nr:zinc-finger domain-containing protein [Gammaproteobacteria bacterium]
MMENFTVSADDANARQPEADARHKVSRADLPLSCPLPNMALWNAHPRVYLPIEQTGCAKCPYCGAEYVLVDSKQ